jgi:hypothetical protein
MLKKEELESIKSMDCLCELYLTRNEHNELVRPLINGVELEYQYFGVKYDTDEENAEPYGCGDMQFIPFEEVKQATLEKYNITESEYRQIQEKLDCLSFGKCGWCV